MKVFKNLSMLAGWGLAGAILGTASTAMAQPIEPIDLRTAGDYQAALQSYGVTITSAQLAELDPWLEQEAKRPYVPVSLGGRLFATGEDIEVKVLPATAGYTSILVWIVPALKSAGLIATNRQVGTVTNIGSFEKGLEIIFGIAVTNTKNFFMTGSGSRNPDRLVHANVNSMGKVLAYVGFEDVYGGGDLDYDDNMFEMRGGIDGQAVPEPVTMFGGAVFGVFAVAAKCKRRHQQKALKSIL